MKHFLYVVFILFGNYCSAQKYVLVDKKMSLPVTYTNAVTVQDDFKGYFPVDKNKIKDFITEVEKIALLCSHSPSNLLPPLFPLPRAYFSVLKEENKNPIAEFEYQHK